jgi:hypothetical protein
MRTSGLEPSSNSCDEIVTVSSSASFDELSDLQLRNASSALQLNAMQKIKVYKRAF